MDQDFGRNRKMSKMGVIVIPTAVQPTYENQTPD